jgi:hypothetical protein
MPGGDEVGERLRQRVSELLAQRRDLDPALFFKAIGRNTPSWRSEFLSGKRTTDSLRLVLTMARFFRVPVAYLVGEPADMPDAATLTLLGAWRALSRQTDRDAVLQLALTLGSDRKGQ